MHSIIENSVQEVTVVVYIYTDPIYTDSYVVTAVNMSSLQLFEGTSHAAAYAML